MFATYPLGCNERLKVLKDEKKLLRSSSVLSNYVSLDDQVEASARGSGWDPVVCSGNDAPMYPASETDVQKRLDEMCRR